MHSFPGRDAVVDTVRAACAIARHTAEDPYNGLADPERLATEFPDLDLYHPWELSVDQAVELALACETSARDTDPRITNSEGATISTEESLDVYATSHGFVGVTETTRAPLSTATGSRRLRPWPSVSQAAPLAMTTCSKP